MMKGQAKIHKVMREFKKGDLHSSSGQRVKSRDQAIAIAMSEAGLSRRDKEAEKRLGKGARAVRS